MLDQLSQAKPMNPVLPLPPKAGAFSLLRFAQNPLKFLQQTVETKGDLFRFNLGMTNLIVVNNPRHIDHVFRANGQNYAKEGIMWELLSSLLGNGLVASQGDFWLRQRRMMQPHFHRRRLAGLTDTMVQAIDETISDWETGQERPVDVTKMTPNLTMNVVVKAVFGSGLSDEDMQAVSESLDFALAFILRGMVTSGIPQWLPVPGRKKYQQSLDTIDRVVYTMIDKRRQEGAEGNDLLAMLLNVVDEETGEGMTDLQIHDEVVNIFLAGYETTATGLAWTMHELATHQDIAEKVRQEVNEVLGDELPTFETLRQLTYTRQVLQEVFRLHTPAWQTTRTAVADDEIDGHRIPAGSLILTCLHTSHRHPSVWPDPLKLDPDRFAPKNSVGRPKYAWMPFGGGQRKCIGLELAMMEATLATAMILQRYDLASVPGREPEEKASLVLVSQDGIWLKIHSR